MPRRFLKAFLAVFGLLAGSASGASNPPPPTLRLPAIARPVSYALDLAIDPAREDFHGAVDIDVRLDKKTDLLWVNATDLNVAKVLAFAGGRSVGARIVDGGEDFVGLAFDRAVGPGELKLHLVYTGRLDATSTQGLFRQKDGEDWYAFSQFETSDARRAFPCFDEPSYKVPWQLTLRIPGSTTAVSNTSIESQENAADGTRIVRFRKTPPLPSYLIALAVGPFDVLDAGRAGSRKTSIRIVTPRGKASQGRYAARTTGPLLERLEAYFGTPFPYEKLDQLAIPQTVTFGAMENAGLITWAERILIAPAEEETIRFQRDQASINAHEMAHQWFGDLVTLAWWDDTWLNESFASWMSDRTITEWKPEWQEDVARVVSRSNVMGEDTLVSARKVHQEIVTKDDIVDAFDDITYQKGAAVLSMFEAWVGSRKFQQGVRHYIAAHRNGNATAADFLAALEAASRPGVAAAFSTFLDQPGVPLVEVSLSCAGGAAALDLSQKRLLPIGTTGSAAQTWQVPVCSRFGFGEKDARACELLTRPSATVPLPGGACPAWLLANEGEIGYYRALYRGDLLEKLLAVADTKLAVAERVGLIRDVNALAEAGAVPMAEALRLVPRFSGDASREVVVASLRIARDIAEHLVTADLRPAYARFLAKTYGARARALGFTSRTQDDDDTRLLRRDLVPFVASEGEDRELQEEARRLALRWLEDRSAIEPEMAGSVLDVAARHGDRELFDRFRSAAKSAKDRRDRRRFYSALGAFQDPALLREALALYLSEEADPREADQILFSASQEEESRQIVWDFVKANYDAIVAKMPREATGIIPLFASTFCDAEHRKDVETFFRDRIEKLPGGSRNLARTLEAIDLCAAAQAAQAQSVREFLKGY